MRLLDRLTDWATRAMLVCAAALGLILSFIVCADVIGRTVFNSPLRGTPEMVSSAIVIICDCTGSSPAVNPCG